MFVQKWKHMCRGSRRRRETLWTDGNVDRQQRRSPYKTFDGIKHHHLSIYNGESPRIPGTHVHSLLLVFNPPRKSVFISFTLLQNTMPYYIVFTIEMPWAILSDFVSLKADKSRYLLSTLSKLWYEWDNFLPTWNHFFI